MFGLLSLAALLGMAACSVTPLPTRLKKTVGTLVATLTLSPERPIPMQATTLELRLEEGRQPIVGATVAMTLTMPGCSMAPSYPVLQPESDGLYKAQMVLTMAGTWQANASVTLPDGRDTLFTFVFATR